MKKKNNMVQKGSINIIMLGLVSFFSDLSSEMVYPLIPLYLTAVFGATPTLVGIIEGIAESIASLLKVFSGYISDRFRHKKAIAFWGYAAGVFYKIALLCAGSWTGILAARVIDRFGKGIRTAPRDVLVSESADKNSMGKAFGIHKKNRICLFSYSDCYCPSALFLYSREKGKKGKCSKGTVLEEYIRFGQTVKAVSYCDFFVYAWKFV